MSGDLAAEAARRAHDRQGVLQRLAAREPIYVAEPHRQNAVRQLAREGLVSFGWGDGRDAGLMIVRRAAPPPRGPWPPAWSPDGGMFG